MINLYQSNYHTASLASCVRIVNNHTTLLVYKMFQILAIDAFRPLGLISIALKNLSNIWLSELGTYCIELCQRYQTLERIFIEDYMCYQCVDIIEWP